MTTACKRSVTEDLIAADSTSAEGRNSPRIARPPDLMPGVSGVAGGNPTRLCTASRGFADAADWRQYQIRTRVGCFRPCLRTRCQSAASACGTWLHLLKLTGLVPAPMAGCRTAA